MTRTRLVTSLGTTPPLDNPLPYRGLDGKDRPARWPAAAVARWLVDSGTQPLQVDVIATYEAIGKNLQSLTDNLAELDVSCPVCAHVVPVAEADVLQITRTHTEALRACDFVEEDIIHFDATNGFRYQPMVLMLMLADRQARSLGQLATIHYGLLDSPIVKQATRGHFIDLLNFLELPRWTRLSREFERYGATEGIIEALNELGRDRLPGQLNPLRQRLKVFGQRLSSGLAVQSLFQDPVRLKLRDWQAISDSIPWAKETLEKVEGSLNKMSLGEVTIREHGLTQGVLLGLEEYVAFTINRGDVGTALRAIPEVLLTEMMFAASVHDGDNWRRNKARLPFSTAIRRAHIRRDRLFHEVAWQCALEAYVKLSEWRNAYAHAGFRLESIDVDAHQAEVQALWSSTLKVFSDPEFARRVVKLADVSEPDLLIAPLGLSSGTLYTAVRRTSDEVANEPFPVIIVASEQTAASIPAIRSALEADGVQLGDWHLVTAHHLDWRSHVETTVPWKTAISLVKAATTVRVSLTGGTTRLAFLAEQLGTIALNAGVPRERIAVVDDRDEVEQRQTPFRLGECVNVDSLEVQS